MLPRPMPVSAKTATAKVRSCLHRRESDAPFPRHPPSGIAPQAGGQSKEIGQFEKNLLENFHIPMGIRPLDLQTEDD